MISVYIYISIFGLEMSYAIEDKLILRSIKTYFVRKGSSFTIFLTKQEMDLTADMITRLNLILHNF